MRLDVVLGLNVANTVEDFSPSNCVRLSTRYNLSNLFLFFGPNILAHVATIHPRTAPLHRPKVFVWSCTLRHLQFSVPNCRPCLHGLLQRTVPLSGPSPPQNATSICIGTVHWPRDLS